MIERVVILGAGESGTGAAVLAKAKGYDVFVSDQAQIKEKYKIELTNASIQFEEGKHSNELILNAQLIIKSPGIPEKAEVIKKVRSKNIPLIDEIEFASRYAKGKIIAITGTNGKTTTTLLTYHLLKSSGVNVALAGNVGESMARKVAVGKYDWYVIEVSSFQLDGTITFKPHIAVLLNITKDHLDRYEYTMQNYVDSKFRITQCMDEKDHFIYYSDDKVILKEIERRTFKSNRLAVSLSGSQETSAYYDGSQMVFNLSGEAFKISQTDTTLKGPHNLINTMAAVSSAHLAGVSVSKIREGLRTFKNAPHRLEHVATINGVEFVNDSKATNVDSVIYGLGSYTQPLIWIAGGIDKGNDYSVIADQVKEKVKALICLGKDNEKLKKEFAQHVESILESHDVKEVVRLALSMAVKGDVVLLSPACASFDLFKNYEDRGDQYREAVLNLKRETEKRSHE